MTDPKPQTHPIEASIIIVTRTMMVICCAFLVLMMLHVGADILLKILLNSPIMGTLETVSYYYMVSLVFLALPFVELRNEHVSVDLFFQKFPKNLQIIVYVLGTLLAAFYYGVFCYITFRDAVIATTQQETVMANFLFYVWPSRWALPLGSGLLVLMLLLNCVRAALRGKLPDTSNSEMEAVA